LIVAIVSVAGGWLLAGAVLPTQKKEHREPETGAVSSKVSALPGARAKVPQAIQVILGDSGTLDFAAMSELMVSLDTASPDDLRRWLVSLPDDEYELTTLILGRWAEIDPAGAVEAIRRNPKLNQHYYKVYSTWAAVDLEAATEFALQDMNSNAFGGLISGAGTEGIEKLYDLMMASNYPHSDPEAFGLIFGKLAEVDPARAAEQAMKAWSKHHGNSPSRVFQVWTAKDPRAAFAWADGVADLGLRKRARQFAAGQLMSSDPLALLELMGDEFEEIQSASQYLKSGSLSDADFAGVLDWFDAQPESQSKSGLGFYGSLLNGLHSSGNPERLAELARRFSGNEESVSHQITSVAASWAEKDVDGLVDFINSPGGSAMRGAAISGLVRHLAEDEPLRAIELVRGLEEPGADIDLSEAVRSLRQQGMAIEDVMSLIPEPLRDNSIGGFWGSFGEQGSAELAVYLSGLSEGGNRDQRLGFSAGYWAREDPLAAAEWAEGLGSGRVNEFAVGNVASSWAMVDSEAAAEWALSLEDPANRSWALLRTAQAVAGWEPERAIRLATEIEDEGHRNDALRAGLLSMARTDPDRAQAQLDEVGLDDDSPLRYSIEQAVEEARTLQRVIDGESELFRVRMPRPNAFGPGAQDEPTE